MNQDCLENRVAHPVTYFIDEAPAFTLPPADRSRVLRLGVHRQRGALVSPVADEVSVAPKRLPWLLPGRFYVVSRDVRIAYHWRPDLLSIADLVYEHGKVVGCRRFVGNGGMAEWQARPEFSHILVNFWTDLEIAHPDHTLVINLMTRKEKQAKGAVNIPPGKHQLRFLEDSIPTYLPVQFLGHAPQGIPNKWQRQAVAAVTPPQENPNEDEQL